MCTSPRYGASSRAAEARYTATCLAYQGYQPFRVADLLPNGDTHLPRAIARGLVRAMVNCAPCPGRPATGYSSAQIPS